MRSRLRLSRVSLSIVQKIMACFTLALSLLSPSSFSKASQGPDACISPMCNSVTTCPSELRKKSGAHFLRTSPADSSRTLPKKSSHFRSALVQPYRTRFIFHNMAESLPAAAFASFQMRGGTTDTSSSCLGWRRARWLSVPNSQVLPSRGNDIDQAIRGHRLCVSVILICGRSLGLLRDKARFPNGVHRTGRQHFASFKCRSVDRFRSVELLESLIFSQWCLSRTFSPISSSTVSNRASWYPVDMTSSRVGRESFCSESRLV